MSWTNLDAPWRVCVTEAWDAYRHGSLPIGAAITDRAGSILARGRNRIYESSAPAHLLHGHRLAHAEMNALVALEWSAITPADCVLYTTTEPCPMCAGAVRMARLGAVRYASRDGAGGAAVLFEATPYMRRGAIQVTGPTNAALEAVLLGMLVEFALRHDDAANSPSWVARLAETVPDGARLGHALYASATLDQWRRDGHPADAVYDGALALLTAGLVR